MIHLNKNLSELGFVTNSSEGCGESEHTPPDLEPSCLNSLSQFSADVSSYIVTLVITLH